MKPTLKDAFKFSMLMDQVCICSARPSCRAALPCALASGTGFSQGATVCRKTAGSLQPCQVPQSPV